MTATYDDDDEEEEADHCVCVCNDRGNESQYQKQPLK